MIELRTFGGLSIEADGAPGKGAAAQRKTLALLALLAGHPRGLSRDKLIAYLWPDTDAGRSRMLLRQGCYALRRDLHADDLFIGSTEMRLNRAVLKSDVQAFESALAAGDLPGAVAQYGGAFLDGFYLSDAAEFERWVETERARLTRQVCDALEVLAVDAVERGDHRTAARHWRRFAHIEPLSSRATLGLMTALAASGETADALRLGKAYETQVRQELGTTAEPALRTLLNRLRLETAAAEGVTGEELTLRRTVGYQQERAALRSALDGALAGRGFVMCVAGEPGSGKTTLVEDFLGEVLASGRPCHIVRGRCSERLAGSGAYLPLLDALEGLLRADTRGAVSHLMQQLAPNWHAQVAPALLANAVQVASQEKLKLELNAFLREVCRLRPLVMFIDDVHWVDASTIDILGYVAGRMGTAPILVVTTYRPSELQLAKHAFGLLKLDLQARGLCREVTLELLTREDVAELLTLEFPNHRFPATLPDFVHEKTEGNPLFIVDLLRYLSGKQVIVADNGGWRINGSVPDLARELPESTRSMIERKVEQLGEADRRLLLAASVQGYECDAPIVAQVLHAEPADIEERLEAVGRVHGFVRRLGEHQFPDGTSATRYRFVHVLYQNALYARLAPARRAQLSRAVAEALLQHSGERGAEIAAELALLFEVGRDVPRAVQYFALAADHASKVFAHREAVLLAQRGIALLGGMPDTPERAGQELGLQLGLGFALQVTKGYSDPESGACMARAREICQQMGEIPPLFPAIYGLWGFYLVGAQMRASRDMAEQLLRLARASGDPLMLYGAHMTMGSSLHHLADLERSREHFEEAIALYDPRQRNAHLALYRQETGPYTRGESIRVLWLLGYPEQALLRMHEMLALAREIGDPQALAFAFVFSMLLHQHRRETELALAQAEACIALATEHGIAAHHQWALLVKGWAVAEQGALEEGLAQLRECLTAQRSMRLLIVYPYWLSLYADILTKAGRHAEGLAAVEEALEVVATTDQRFYESELRRLKGELLLYQGGPSADAERCFRDALAVAARQQAKSLELRAATRLSRLWQQQGKSNSARDLLAPVASWFTEGFDTVDLRDAKALLDQLG